MSIRWATVTALIMVGCGGNYSNEDLDFQAALPVQQELAVKLPQLVQEPPADAPEYYRVSREVARGSNGLLDGILRIIDGVRAFPATTREPQRRTWGPFPLARHPLWVSRLVIQMEPKAGAPEGFQFAYHLDVKRRAQPEEAWRSLVVGSYAPTGGARRGEGEFSLLTAEPRTMGYPLDDLGELERVKVAYKTGSFPVTVVMDLANRAGSDTPQAHYEYREEANGSGDLLFAFTRAGDIWASAIDIRARWIASGAGRADAVVTEGLARGTRGVDCWGSDTRMTFMHRDWMPSGDQGNASACVFPTPP